MVLDIIYVNYNSTNHLIKSIETLFQWTQKKYDLNIVVVDNHSDDNAHRLTEHFPEIQLIENNKNIGFGAAINQGLTYCHSEFVIFLNPDSLVTDGFIEESVGFMRRHETIGVIGPKVLDEDGTVQGSARAFPTPMTSLFGRNSPITKIFPNNSITRANILTSRSDGESPMEVDWVSGACMVVRREAMQAVGSFDERFFLYWEDTDLCRRIRETGWKVLYYPRVTVIHYGGKSSNTRPVFANLHFHRSCYRLYNKYAVWPFSLFTPVAGMALMIRFLIAALFNHLSGAINPTQIGKQEEKSGDVSKTKKIRVLRIISRMNIGGPSIHVKNLTEGLPKNIFISKLITGTVSPSEGDMSYITSFDNGVRIVIPEMKREIDPFNDMLALLQVIKIMKKFRPHIVHSHMSKAGTIARLAAIICNFFHEDKCIVVHTFHGHVLDGYFNKGTTIVFRLIERFLAKLTDRIIAISDSQKWELSNVYKIDLPKKIDMIKLGFDLTPFLNCSQQRGIFRSRMNFSDDTILIGIVGRMAPIKNHRMFLDSAKLLLNKVTDKKIKFVLVGAGEEGPFLEQYATDIGIIEHVYFHGWEKNISLIYADIDILALTSLNEGTPVSVIESMAASVPVVTTGVGGIKDLLGRFDVVQPGDAFKICKRGILCPKDNPIVFSNALKYMVESGYLHDTCRLEKARDYVVRNYSMEHLIRDVEALYRRLIHAGEDYRNFRPAEKIKGGIHLA